MIGADSGRYTPMGAELFDSLYGGLEKVLDLRQQQHSLTTANLANADTPGFKARVIPFDGLLQDVVNGESEALRGDDPEVQELEAPPWAEDGNSVTLERETARLNENLLLFNGVSRGMSRRFGLLKYAAGNGK